MGFLIISEGKLSLRNSITLQPFDWTSFFSKHVTKSKFISTIIMIHLPQKEVFFFQAKIKRKTKFFFRKKFRNQSIKMFWQQQKCNTLKIRLSRISRYLSINLMKFRKNSVLNSFSKSQKIEKNLRSHFFWYNQRQP